MKLFFRIIIPILIGILSAIAFKQHLTSLATKTANLVYNFTTNTPATSEADNLLPQQQQLQEQQQQEQQQQTLYSPSENLTTSAMSVSRTIRQVILAVEKMEGDGARVRRSIGIPQLRHLTPFLMLDHFSIKPPAGFPEHPHRGQETITYLLKGAVEHEDFAGHRGAINAGDLQFMTAGRGIVHSEMPRDNPDGSDNVGLQLWVDLPKKLKSCEPRYRDLSASEIPSVEVDDGKATIKVISGQSHGVDSVKDLAYTPVWLLDVTLRPGAKVTQAIPQGWTAFAYTLEGNTLIGKGDQQKKIEQFNNVVFENEGDVVHLEADPQATEPSRLVLVAGTPLDQPIIQYGPFVVNSKEEVYQALHDYQTFSNGFERAKDWESEIGRPKVH